MIRFGRWKSRKRDDREHKTLLENFAPLAQLHLLAAPFEFARYILYLGLSDALSKSTLFQAMRTAQVTCYSDQLILGQLANRPAQNEQVEHG